MKGSTRKRGRTWTAQWRTTIYNTETGESERKQCSKGGFLTEAAADAHLGEALPEVRAGTYAEPSTEPFASYCTKIWLPTLSDMSPLTISTYGSIIDRYVVRRPEIAAVPLKHVTGGTIQGLYLALEREGLSPGTRRLLHTVLSRACADAVKWKLLKVNPVKDATPPPRTKTKARAWTAGELRRFLEHVADDRLVALWRLGATTGMRRGELLGVTWRALDLDGARLEVSQQVIPTRGGATFGPPKWGSERTLVLDPETVDALRRHRENQLLERALADSAYHDHDLVFCREDGDPIYPTKLTDRCTRLRKGAGISFGSAHTLRHTMATLALTEGIPLHIVAARLGDDPKQVLDTYAHLLPRSDEQAAKTLAAVLVDRDRALVGVDRSLTNAATTA